MRSFHVYVLPLAGGSSTNVTTGRGTGFTLPFTLRLLSAGSPPWSSLARVTPSESAFSMPPFRLNAPLGTRTPSESIAPCPTTYVNRSARSPIRSLQLDRTCTVSVPTSSDTHALSSKINF